MAPRKRNKQDELNRTYRNADVGRVGSSLRNQGYNQDKAGNTYYTVGGVKYDATSGRPVKPEHQPKPKKQKAQSVQEAVASRPRPTAVTSGSSSSSNRPAPSASRPASDAGMKNQDKNYRGSLFEKTFGYKKGEAPDQVAKREHTKTAYSGDSIANTTVPTSKDYSGSKTTDNTSTAYGSDSLNKKSETLAEKLRKRRSRG